MPLLASRSRCCSRPRRSCARWLRCWPKATKKTTLCWRKWMIPPTQTPWRQRPEPMRAARRLPRRRVLQPLAGRKFPRDDNAPFLNRTMNLQALLVSSDDSAADVLGRVLSSFEIAMDRSSDPETTLARIQQQKFDALVVDFDAPQLAHDVLAEARKLGSAPLAIALVADNQKVREILNSGAHFVLYKPIAEDSAKAGLRPAAGLLSRERRRAFRVPVQAPVEITLADGRKVDGI